MALPAKYDFKPIAFGFQKDSPFLPYFNYYLREMREKGSLQQILEKYQPKPQICPDDSGKPLGFESCFTAFIALCFGIGCAMILFLVEKFARLRGANLSFLYLYEQTDYNSINMKYLLDQLIMKNEENEILKKKIKTYESRNLTSP